jgi:hypothetical protein
MLFVGAISVYSCAVLVECTRHSSRKHPSIADLAGEYVLNPFVFKSLFIRLIVEHLANGENVWSTLCYFSLFMLPLLHISFSREIYFPASFHLLVLVLTPLEQIVLCSCLWLLFCWFLLVLRLNSNPCDSLV